MKRGLTVLLATVIVVLGVRAIARSLASDETKIRWRIESMVEGYNTGDVGDAIGPLAKDWRHEDFPYDREAIRGGLIRESLQDRDRETGKLRRRVELDADTLSIQTADDTATLEVEASFQKLEGDEWTERWRARISGDLRNGENGWFLFASRHEDLVGTPLSR